jgi:orotate phosphoribosyltransferase
MRRRLLALIRERSFRTGKFTLASGEESNYYVDLRTLTTHPAGAFLSGLLLLDLMMPFQPTAAGGPTLGADPICGAVAVLSHLRGAPLHTFIVRSQAKDHGTGRLVEGSLEPGDRAVIFDDVATRGGNLIKAAKGVRDHGATVVGAVVILDRQKGAEDVLQDQGIPLRSIYRVSELLDEG